MNGWGCRGAWIKCVDGVRGWSARSVRSAGEYEECEECEKCVGVGGGERKEMKRGLDR